MRPNAVLFALLTLVTLPACQRIEDKVEAKAEAKAESVVAQKIGLPATGMVMTKGVCPNWPKTVPVYPNRTSILCQKLDAAQIQSTPQFKIFLASQPPEKKREIEAALAAHPAELETSQLTVYTTDSPEAVDAFYEKAFPNPDGSPIGGLIPVQPLFVHDGTATTPGSFCMRLTVVDPQSRQTAVTLVLVYFPSAAPSAKG